MSKQVHIQTYITLAYYYCKSVHYISTIVYIYIITLNLFFVLILVFAFKNVSKRHKNTESSVDVTDASHI